MALDHIFLRKAVYYAQDLKESSFSRFPPAANADLQHPFHASMSPSSTGSRFGLSDLVPLELCYQRAGLHNARAFSDRLLEGGGDDFADIGVYGGRGFVTYSPRCRSDLLNFRGQNVPCSCYVQWFSGAISNIAHAVSSVSNKALTV